jgi:hypothetical protein
MARPVPRPTPRPTPWAACTPAEKFARLARDPVVREHFEAEMDKVWRAHANGRLLRGPQASRVARRTSHA